MKKKIIHLVNPNGLGHLKRAIFIWNNIFREDLIVELVIDYSHEKSLTYFNLNPSILISKMNLDGMISLSNIKSDDFKSNYYNLHNKLISSDYLKDADLIISDNSVLDFSKINSKFMMIGSFLWLDILKGNDFFKDIYNNELKMLNNNQPEIFGIKNFISGSLVNYSNLKKTGWYGINRKREFNLSKKGILFSGGLGNLTEDFFNDILLRIKDHKTDYQIYSSINYRFINNSLNFNFNEDWDKISFVIARPGIGTITDCIENKVPIIAIGEKYNSEIVANASQLAKFNIGFDCVSKPFNLDFLSKINNINFDKVDFSGLIHIKKRINEFF